MKSIFFAVGLAVSLGAVPAHAQGTGLDGKWTVKWTSSAGNPGEAELELSGASGNFKQFARVVRGKPDPCVTVKAPVTAEINGDEATFLVRTSEALSGCADRRIRVKKVDERSFQGTFGTGGTALTMVRQD